MNKLKELFGSRRFWQITLAYLVQLVKLYWPEHEEAANLTSVFLLTVAGIGTIDKLRK